MKYSYFEAQGGGCRASGAQDAISCPDIPRIVEGVAHATQSHPLVFVFSGPGKQFFDDSLGPVRYFSFFDMELHEQYNDLLTMKIAKQMDPGQPVCFESRGSNAFQRYLAFEMLFDDYSSLEAALAFIRQQSISVFDVEHVIVVCNAGEPFSCVKAKEQLEETGCQKEEASDVLKEAFADWRGTQKRKKGQTALARTILISDVTELSFPDLKILPYAFEATNLQPVLPDILTAQSSYAAEEKRNVYIFDQSRGHVCIDCQAPGDGVESFLSFPKQASEILYHAEALIKYHHSIAAQDCVEARNAYNDLPGRYDADSTDSFSFGATGSGASCAGTHKMAASTRKRVDALPFSDFVSQRYPEMDRSIYYVVRAFRQLFEKPSQQFSVQLNVYKLTKTGILTAFGIGIHHSGWCFGNAVEIGFGYADADGTGIYSIYPGGFSEKDLIQKIDYKQLQMSRERFVSLLVEACARFPARSYDLLRFNCNDFSDYMARVMGFGAIPEWVNRAARVAQKFTKQKQTGSDEVRKK